MSVEDSVARIRNGAGAVVGTGFLIGSDLLCTCAHVVANATGTEAAETDPPALPVMLDFPLAGTAPVAATVARWIPIRGDQTGDLAVLRLDAAAPPGVWSAHLSPDGGGWNESIRIFGFPAGRDDGMWISGRLRGRQATGWTQFEAVEGPRVSVGFSGAPVWSDVAGGVVGMVVAAEPNSTTAYLAPLGALLDDGLLSEVLPRCPYRGLEAFREDDADLFFGRRREAERLADYVAHRRLVVVSGPSGCGKSSLVSAALWPQLRAAGATIVDLIAQPLEPRELLRAALLPVLGPAWADRLRDQPPAWWGREIATKHDRVVLFLDQFEEVAAAEPAVARELFTLVAGLVSGPPLRPGKPPAVQAILTLRSPVIDEVLTAEHAEVLDDGSVYVLPMGREDLRAAITEPARSAGLVRFEPGLVDRIVDDALTAPGQLPLLQFTMTLLWQRQRGGLLTHAAYADIGHVAGAIARYADSVYTHLPTATDRALAKQLLVHLVRPTDNGSFALAPVALDELDPGLADLARRLAALRLLVIRQDRGQPPMIALAHEALIWQWQTLHDWLVADREFLAWHARLRTHLSAWKEAREDPGGLLRGAPLAEAEDRAVERPAVLTEEERRFIAASRAAARRGVRRWRIVSAVIATLAVVASVLAAAAVDQSQKLADRLRRQAAVALARESMARMDTQPVTALQFAQAAAAHDPASPEAEAAILLQQARFADMKAFRSLWKGPLFTVASSTDGSAVAVAETNGAVTLWSGLLGGEPTPWRVTSEDELRGLRLSGDGTRLAVFGKRGSIDVWDVPRRTGPLLLRPETVDGPAPATAKTAAFTPDGGTLVVAFEPRAGHGSDSNADAVEVYDTVGGRRLPSALDSPGAVDVEVLRVEAGGRAVWLRESGQPDDEKRNVVRDIGSGRLLRDLPAGWVAADGTVLSCAGSSKELTGRDGNTGAVRYRATLPDCPIRSPLDATGRYALLDNGLAEDVFQLLTMVDARTGDAYQVQYPHVRRPRITIRAEDGGGLTMVHPTPAGPEVVELTNQGVVRTFPGTRRESPALFTSSRSPQIQFNQRGTLAAAYFDVPRSRHAGLEVYALPSQRRIAGGRGTPLADLQLARAPVFLFTSDDRFLVARAADDALVVLSTADYTIQRRLRLPVPAALAPDRSADSKMTLIPQPGDEVAVLYAGAFTRWRVGTGERIGEPLPLRDDPTELRRDAQLASAGARPDHPGQMFVPLFDGVELWDLNTGAKVTEFRPEPDRRLLSGAAGAHSPLVALHTSAGMLYLWDPAAGRQRGEPGPLPTDRRLIDLSPNDLLIVDAGEAVELWDMTIGRSIVAIDPPGFTPTWHITGNTLLGLSDDGMLEIDLDRDSALAKLCAFHDVPYTEAELRLLPEGADDSPPCQIARR